MPTSVMDEQLGSRLPDHLGTHLHDWVDHDLITTDEADRIASFEGSRVTGGRIPAAAEIVGYLGAVLVLAAGSVVYGQSFDSLSRFARVAYPAVAAVLALGAGIPLVRNGEPTFRRVGGVLWAASVALAALSLAVEFADRDVVPSYTAFAIGACCALYALALYAFVHQGAIQFVMFAASITTVIGGIAWATSEDPSGAGGLYATALLALGLVWVAAGVRERLIPRGEAIFLGGALALYAPTLLGAQVMWLALALGLLVSAGLLALSTWLRVTSVLVISGIALFGYLVTVITTYLADTMGAPIALALSGIALIAVAILVSRLRRFARSSEASRRRREP